MTDVVSDGNPAYRVFNEDRILRRLTNDDFNGRSPLHDYISLTSNISIIHLSSNHKNYQPGTDEYMHANFLQITDLLLGSILRSRNVSSNVRITLPRIEDKCVKKDIITQPVREILDKKKRGSGFRQSGHYKSFTITQAIFGKKIIKFKEFYTPHFQLQNSLQMQFIFNGKISE